MLQLNASNKVEKQSFDHAGPVVFGRDPEPGPGRCVITDPFVSRSQLKVEELPGKRARLENLSRTNPVVLADGSHLATGASREFPLPVRATIGETLIDIAAAEDGGRESLRTITQPVVQSDCSIPSPLAAIQETPGAETLARWFETLVVVQRAAASSAAFYDQTARAIVELVGLDCGLVLLRKQSDWEVAARYAVGGTSGADFSQTILRRVVEERRTYFDSYEATRPSASLTGVEAVVASPIIDEKADQVVGVLYGVRHRSPLRPACEIRPLEAQVVQILASVASVGRARVLSEAESTRRHVLFEQFFSADLSNELERDPRLLDGREREVTILFSDIRGFSKLSESLTPQESCNLVCDVMERLTTRIRQHHGVVVDYIGDGLLAMWNAPSDQSDHAALACRAALAMQSELPGLSDAWRGVIGGPLKIGIGLNTGLALVGNTGSRQKFKYGPLGHAVNLASRVEGATKQLGVPILITGKTRERLGDAFATRRLGKVRVMGIGGAVELFELHAESADPDWCSRREAYEVALALFEEGRWDESCEALYPLLTGQLGRYDQPSLTLISLAIECLKSPPVEFDPVFELDRK